MCPGILLQTGCRAAWKKKKNLDDTENKQNFVNKTKTKLLVLVDELAAPMLNI